MSSPHIPSVPGTVVRDSGGKGAGGGGREKTKETVGKERKRVGGSKH